MKPQLNPTVAATGTASPPHSTASISATSSTSLRLLKRKLSHARPPFDVSPRADDSDPTAEATAASDDNDDNDRPSIRTFTAARLERKSKLSKVDTIGGGGGGVEVQKVNLSPENAAKDGGDKNGGEDLRHEKEFEQEEQNYEGSENEEPVNEDVISGLRVRRGQQGRFELYTEGSSSSVPESRRKIRARGKDTSWILTGPAPGGPVVPDVIPSFAGHVAHILWSQPELQRMLTKYTRERSLAELHKWNLSEAVRRIVEDSGLSHLPSIMHKHINMPLICAFIERWQPDTNTFHMPWGEMTILLHDVAEILGIEIDGRPCSISEEDIAHPVLGMSELLGMTETELGEQWGSENDAKIYKGNSILNKALRDLIQGDKRGSRSEAQGYLLILLGSTLFVDKSSDRVRANTFPMLRDVDSIDDYAWGAGTLAYLYRQLGIATRADCKGLCGCLTLLQSWIYEYFPSFRPTAMLASTPGSPRATIWSTSAIPKAEAHRALVSYREQLDLMPIESVAWRPYPSPPETEHPRSLYHGLLRFLDIVEPYQPDRCLRQFGYMQTIPIPMARPDKAYRPCKSIAYDVQYDGAFMDYTWSSWSMHKTHLDLVSTPAHPPHAHEKGYMEWFISISHPYVTNVPRDDDHMPVARSHFPTMVGEALIQRFSQFDDVRDPAIAGEITEFMRTFHPQIRAYVGRHPVAKGSRGRGRRSVGIERRAREDDQGSSEGNGEPGSLE